MKTRDRIYVLQNENIKSNINEIILKNKAYKYFHYIDPNIINIQTGECINLGVDVIGLTEYYIKMNYYMRDPFLNQLKYARMQTFHYKELEMSQIKMLNSDIRVGVMLNQERSRLFGVHNGMYRTIQMSNKYCLVCLYGKDKKDFLFEVDFSACTKSGQWFERFERELIDVIKKYLNVLSV